MVRANEFPVALRPEVIEELLVLLPLFLPSLFLLNPQRFLRVLLGPADIDIPTCLLL